MESLASELEAHLSAIVERRENIPRALANLDALLAKHRADIPERLTHFLERRSYQKALMFLREGDTGHHP